MNLVFSSAGGAEEEGREPEQSHGRSRAESFEADDLSSIRSAINLDILRKLLYLVVPQFLHL